MNIVRASLLVLCAAILAVAARSFVWLRPAGVDFKHENSPTSQRYLLETMGGGVGLLDYNGDGRLDIFMVNGGKLDDPAKPSPDYCRRDPRFWNRLYRQNADGSFTDVTAGSGLSDAGNNYGMGVAVGDYNNDGFPDIYVTGYPHNKM